MIQSSLLSVYSLPFTMRYPFTVFPVQWLMANGKCTVNGKWLMVNGFTGGKAC